MIAVCQNSVQKQSEGGFQRNEVNQCSDPGSFKQSHSSDEAHCGSNCAQSLGFLKFKHKVAVTCNHTSCGLFALFGFYQKVSLGKMGLLLKSWKMGVFAKELGVHANNTKQSRRMVFLRQTSQQFSLNNPKQLPGF